MQQTLKLRARDGYSKNVAPWEFVPKELRGEFSRDNEEDAVRRLNEMGWKVIAIFQLDGGPWDKEFWLTREVDDSAEVPEDAPLMLGHRAN